MDIIKDLKSLKCGQVIKDVLLSKYTTYRLDEKALCLVTPNNLNDLIKLIKYLKDNHLKYKIIGNGSNLIFAHYYDGILIKLDKLSKLIINNDEIEVEGGYSLIKLAMEAAKKGLSGLEFASGIPGTIGGAIYMNAGAYNASMSNIVKEIKVLDNDLNIKTLTNQDLNFSYRSSLLKSNHEYICLSAKLKLNKGDSKVIWNLMKERKQKRNQTQPLEYPSAGSVFRNPDNDYAGRIIEELGFKGKNINDAAVSNKHANFIINLGKAKGIDIINLIKEINNKVKQKYNIELELEQEIVE